MMPRKKKVESFSIQKVTSKVELTAVIGQKEVIAIVTGPDTAKILCKDRSGTWLFSQEHIDQYVFFLNMVKQNMRTFSTEAILETAAASPTNEGQVDVNKFDVISGGSR